MPVDWKPHPQQEIFLERGEFEVLYGGAAGGGKSDALIMAASYDIDFPKYHGLIVRRTFPQLQEIIDRCFEYYPQLGGEYRATLHRWEWPNGAKITLGHMQHERDKEGYQGKEFHFVGFDELTHFTETQYLYLISRVRRSSKGLGLVFRATTNPGSIGHMWVKDRFIDGKVPYKTYVDQITGQSSVFIPATVYDNPSIMDNDPGYVRRLEALPEIEKLRLLHGVWDVFEGQVFTELTQKVHGSEPFEIPPEWEHWMVFDWGYARPWCALWFAMDFNGVIYLYREKYGMVDGDPNKGARQTNDQICNEILEIEKEKMAFRIADPACWAPTKMKGSNTIMGPSFIEDAGKQGLWFLKADNDRIRGKQQVHQRLMLETVTNSEGLVTEEYPRFVAFNDCKHWWKEMQGLYEDPRNPEDVDTDQPDEGYDCTRYSFMSRPIIPKRKEHEPKGTFQQERKRLINAKKYAKRHGVSLSSAYGVIR
jgi:hypothetical protein